MGAQIANLESGRKRGLDVAELLVLAAALDVPPVTLLFPGLPDADTEKLPGQTVSAVAAMLWFTGEYADSDLGRLLKLSRDRLLKQAQHKAATELMEGFAAKATSDAEIERAAAMILAVIDKADDIRELDRQISAIPGAVIAEKESVE